MTTSSLSHSRKLIAVSALCGTALISMLAESAPAAAIGTVVPLATASSYSVLAGSTVTNTGPTTLSGDYGVSPGTAITGFPPGTAGGVRHAKDAQANQAKTDLTTAYDNAAGQASDFGVAGDLVGRTLTAGVYTSSGPLAVSGTLTFNGQGNANSIFIVQVAKTLITATSSQMVAVNGAQACHIFWQVGSSATLGTASTFQGTVMAQASITVTTSAHVKGRALARTGAVTLDNDVFSSPDCSNATSPTGATATTTTVAATTTVPVGGTLTLRAAVSGPGGTPTGTVQFSENGRVVGSAPVGVTGQATLHVSAGTTARTGLITARFLGSPNEAPSVAVGRPFTVIAVAKPVAATVAPTAAAAVPVVAAATAQSPAEVSRAKATTANNEAVLAATGTSHTSAITGASFAMIGGGLILLWSGRRRVVGNHRRPRDSRN